MRVHPEGRKEGERGSRRVGGGGAGVLAVLAWWFPPNLFLIAVSSDGIRVAGEVPNISVALVRVHAHATRNPFLLSAAGEHSSLTNSNLWGVNHGTN